MATFRSTSRQAGRMTPRPAHRRTEQALRAPRRAVGLHAGRPGRPRRRPRRPQRRGQEHAAQPRRRACCTPTAGTIEVLGGRPPSARRSWPKVGFVAQDTPTYGGPERRRPPAARRAPQPGLGRRPGAAADRAARARPRAEGAQALRRPARAARAHARHRQAPGAADPRRAGRQPRPARAARVPAGPDGGRRRARAQRVLSSHLVSDLERACDYLVVLVDSRVQLAGDIDALWRRTTG